jgi:signal transduction histidine kinase
LILGLAAGICAGFGLMYLFIGLRHKQDKALNLTFSLFALAYAGAIITAAGQYATTTIADYIAAGRFNGPFVVLAWTALIWYVALYTNVRPRPLLIIFTFALVIAGILNTIGPDLLYERILGLEFLTLPWGEQLALAQGPEGPGLLLFLLTQVAIAIFILVACVIQFRRGERQAALILGIGLIWFIFTIIVDSLVDTGTISFVYLSDFGFLVLAISLSLQMAASIIRTEEELADYRQDLEGLVSERTAELEQTQQELVQQAQQTAAAEERGRLARDLHDAVTQTIYSAALIAEALPQVWERNPDEGRRNLTKLRQLVRGALAEMRTLLFELRPAALEHADLESLLRQLTDALTGRTRIPVTVEAEGQAELPAEVRVAYYRITQESFNNIAKHAAADQVSLTLKQSTDRVDLVIVDNGRGFDPEKVATGNMGISIMRERARSIGADLKVKSAPGEGVRLDLLWTRSQEVSR